MHLDWLAFVLVVLTSLGAAVVVVTLFSTGIRLLATPGPAAAVPAGTARDEEFDDVPRGRRPPLVTAAAVVLLALSGAAALVGVLLLVVLR